MARQNKIPQFDSSDTNIGEAPDNGFSANTTIASAQVNGAIRWSSFAITAMLNAFAGNTSETASYEYTKNGATGVNTLSNQIFTDLKYIIKHYTFDAGGTFGDEVTFTYNTTFKGTSSTTDAPNLRFVSPTSSNHHREMTVSAYSAYGTKFYTLAVGCEEWAGQGLSESFGKLNLRKNSSETTDSNVTFPAGTYTLRPYYTHHLNIVVTPNTNSKNIKRIDMYLVVTLPIKNKLTLINQLNQFLDKGVYNATGIVNVNNLYYYPVYLLEISETSTSWYVHYINDGQDLYSTTSKDTYEIDDKVVSYD